MQNIPTLNVRHQSRDNQTAPHLHSHDHRDSGTAFWLSPILSNCSQTQCSISQSLIVHRLHYTDVAISVVNTEERRPAAVLKAVVYFTVACIFLVVVCCLTSKSSITSVSFTVILFVGMRFTSLLSHVHKLFTWTLQRRMEKILGQNQPGEHTGFRKGYSTVDHLQVINQPIEKCNEFSIPLCI